MLDGFRHIELPTQITGGQDLDIFRSLDVFGLDHLVIQIAWVSHGGGSHVGDTVFQHQQGHIFLGLVLAAGGGSSKSAAGGGAAALHTCVTIGLIVIAEVNDIVITLGGCRKSLEAYVIGAAIPDPAKHGG